MATKRKAVKRSRARKAAPKRRMSSKGKSGCCPSCSC